MRPECRFPPLLPWHGLEPGSPGEGEGNKAGRVACPDANFVKHRTSCPREQCGCVVCVCVVCVCFMCVVYVCCVYVVCCVCCMCVLCVFHVCCVCMCAYCVGEKGCEGGERWPISLGYPGLRGFPYTCETVSEFWFICHQPPCECAFPCLCLDP